MINGISNRISPAFSSISYTCTQNNDGQRIRGSFDIPGKNMEISRHGDNYYRIIGGSATLHRNISNIEITDASSYTENEIKAINENIKNLKLGDSFTFQDKGLNEQKVNHSNTGSNIIKVKPLKNTTGSSKKTETAEIFKLENADEILKQKRNEELAKLREEVSRQRTKEAHEERMRKLRKRAADKKV